MTPREIDTLVAEKVFGGTIETTGTKRYRLILTAPGMPMEGVEADTAPMAICVAALLEQGVAL